MKDKIIPIVKLFVMVSAMIHGFFFTYAFVWFLLGLPGTKIALVFLYALAVLSEYGFYKWVAE